MARIVRHKRLAIALCIAWAVIGLAGEFVMLWHLKIPLPLANKVLAMMMTFIALLFVAAYEWVLLPVKEDRRTHDNSEH